MKRRPRKAVTDPSILPRPFPVVVALLQRRTGIRMSTQRAQFVCAQALRKMRDAMGADADPAGDARGEL